MAAVATHAGLGKFSAAAVCVELTEEETLKCSKKEKNGTNKTSNFNRKYQRKQQ